jgi:quinol monooxygenase YgiN
MTGSTNDVQRDVRRGGVEVTRGLFVRIEAKPGREAEVEAQLRAGLAAVLEEPDTTAWLAIRLGPTTFAVVDAFPHEAGRQFHLAAGRERLTENEAMDLYAEPPSIAFTDIVAAKLPSAT